MNILSPFRNIGFIYKLIISHIMADCKAFDIV